MRSSRTLTLLAALTIAGSAFAAPAPPAVFVRGDCAANGGVGLEDAVQVLLHLFQGADVKCEKACDADADGRILLNDAIQTLRVAAGEPIELAAPSRECGFEDAETAEQTEQLSCESFDVCQ